LRADIGCEGGKRVRQEEAAQRESRIQGRGAVALAQDEPVPPRVVRRPRIDAQDSKKQGRKDVADREVAPDVARPRAANHPDDALADLAGDRLQALPAFAAVHRHRKRREHRLADR